MLLVDPRKASRVLQLNLLGEGNIVVIKTDPSTAKTNYYIWNKVRDPSSTTRGFKETQFKQARILRILDNVHSERSSQVISKVKEVIELCSEFPIY